MPFCVSHETDGGPSNARLRTGFFNTFWVNDTNYTNAVFQLQWHRCENFLPPARQLLRAKAKASRSEAGEVNVDVYRIILRLGEPYTCIASSDSYTAIKLDWVWLESNVMPKLTAAFKAMAVNAAPPTEQHPAVVEVMETDLMAKVVEEVISYAKQKEKEAELPTFLSALETIQKSFSVSELGTLKSAFEKNPECKTVPRDHMLPVNVALQLIDERIKHLKRELFEDLESGGEAILITDMCQEVLRQMRGEVAARLQATRAAAANPNAGIDPQLIAMTAGGSGGDAARPSVMGGGADSAAGAGAPAGSAVWKQQIATVLYKCFTDMTLMSKSAAFLDPKADEEAKKLEADATLASAEAKRRESTAVGMMSPGKGSAAADSKSSPAGPTASGGGMSSPGGLSGLPALPEMPTLSVDIVLAAQQQLLALTAAQLTASAAASASAPAAPTAPTAPEAPPAPMAPPPPADLPATSAPKPFKLSVASFRRGNKPSRGGGGGGGEAGGMAINPEDFKLHKSPTPKSKIGANPSMRKTRGFAPNLMDILKSRMKNVRMQVEPDDPYKTMAFANGTLDWGTLKPKAKPASAPPASTDTAAATAAAAPSTGPSAAVAAAAANVTSTGTLIL